MNQANNEDLVEFYHYRLFKKLSTLQTMERAAFMADIFGKRWFEVYERITILYPDLLDTK